MIPIQFKGNEIDVVQQLYNDLINEKLKHKYKSEINEINDWCIKNIIVYGKRLNFEDVIKADFGTLENIVEILNNKKSPPPSLHKTFIVDYLYNQKLNEKSYRLKFIDYLGVTVCPYCNRNFVNSAKKLDNRNQVKIKKISMIFHGFYCTLKIPEEKALFFRVV